MTSAGQAVFKNRRTAGEKLVHSLEDYTEQNTVVLGIPRGGVPIAEPVARALDAELDVIIVKKLGAPGNPELAIGAVGESGEPYLNDDLIDTLDVNGEYIRSEMKKCREKVNELAAEFRDVKQKAEIKDRTVILVDDGIATGATIRACEALIRAQNPSEVILAVPVAPLEAVSAIESDGVFDEIVCEHVVDGYFGAIGAYYLHFPQVSTDTVRELL